MTNPSKKKPRECFVSQAAFLAEGIHYARRHLPKGGDDIYVHVVEKSAYEKAMERIENLKVALEKMQAGYAGMFGSDKRSERDDAWHLGCEIVEAALKADEELK